MRTLVGTAGMPQEAAFVFCAEVTVGSADRVTMVRGDPAGRGCG